MVISKRDFYISKRAKIIEPPREMWKEIYEWAKGVYSRKAAEYYEEKPGYESWIEDAKKYATDEPDEKTFKVDLTDWKHGDIPAGGFVGDMPLWDLIESAHLFPELRVKFAEGRRRGNQITKAEWNKERKLMTIFFHPPIFPIEMVLRGDVRFLIKLKHLRDTIGHELIHFAQDLVTMAKKFAESPIASTPFGMPPKKHKPKHVTPEGRHVQQDQGFYIFHQNVPHALRETEFYPRLFGDAQKIKRSLQLLPQEERMKAFKTFMAAGPDFLTEIKDGRKFAVTPLQTLEALKPKTKKYRIAVKAIYDYVKELL